MTSSTGGSAAEKARLAAAAPDETRPVGDNRRAWIAILAGWAVPGLGHLLLGRVRRAVVYGAVVWGAFGMGVSHDGSLALRDPKQPFLTALQIVANVGVGPADFVARWFVYGTPAYSLNEAAGRSHRPTTTYRRRIASELSIYGTAYLWTAGLMNLLLLFDLWDIGRGRKD